MESAPNDVLDRLTTAVDGWDAQWEACHLQIMDALTHAQASLERETKEIPGDAPVETNVEELQQLQNSLSEREERIAALEARNAELESQIAGLRETLDALLVERVQLVEESAVRPPDQAVPEPVQPEETETVESPFAEPALLGAEVETRLQTLDVPDAGETASVPDAPRAFIEIQAFDDKGHKRRIGDILVDLGVVTRKQLKEMLTEQSHDPQRRLGTLAVARGYTDEELVARILAAQLQLPFIRLSDAEIDTAALNKVSPQIARSRKCVPLAVDGDCLRIAMANPLDLIAVEDIEISTRLRVEPVVATPGEIDVALRTFYGAH